MIGIGKNLFKGNVKAAGGSVVYDADAQAYFTANTAITSTADKNAINTFYLGLKSDGIYTKIKAMYLPIWGSAASCKWNLVNPLDTNAAFRLTFHGTSWAFSSSGMTPTNAYADTYLTTSVIGLNSGHLSYYSRTNSTGSYKEMGALQNIPNSYTDIGINFTGFGAIIRYNDNSSTTGTANANTQGFYIGSRTASNVIKLFKNGSTLQSLTSASGSTSSTRNIYIGAQNNQGTAEYFTNRQCSFSSIGTGLTDTEATNFSNRVNTLLAYFGINTYPVVSDADAQAYINANDAITSQSDANAINTFFTGLKADGIYTKIQAMYLPIWGSAANSKWNLINNRSFDLSFSTGWTYTSSGITPLNANARTFYQPSANAQLNSHHLSYYSRTNSNGSEVEIGHSSASNQSFIVIRTSGITYGGINQLGSISAADSNSLGFYIATRTSSSIVKVLKNGSVLANTGTTASTSPLGNVEIRIGALWNGSIAQNHSVKQCAFSSIGTGLTDAEAANFNTRVNTLMTYFGINV